MIELGREEARKKGLKNLELFDTKGEDMIQENFYDFAYCLDIVHDCPFPDQILSSLYKSLKPGGTLLVKDIKSTGNFKQNLDKIPNLAMMYGMSLSMCMSP